MKYHYFNTNRESGKMLAESESKAATQEERIKQFFNRRPLNLFSPDFIQRNVFGGKVPLTSVRRAMTNLTKEEYLEKTDVMTEGTYGKMVHQWRRNHKDPTQQVDMFMKQTDPINPQGWSDPPGENT